MPAPKLPHPHRVEPFNFQFCYCKNQKQLNAITDELKIERGEYIRQVGAVHFLEGKERTQQIAALCIGQIEGISYIQVIGIVAHECMHIWQKALEWAGECSPSIEFEAYSIQRMVQTILGEMAQAHPKLYGHLNKEVIKIGSS